VIGVVSTLAVVGFVVGFAIALIVVFAPWR